VAAALSCGPVDGFGEIDGGFGYIDGHLGRRTGRASMNGRERRA